MDVLEISGFQTGVSRAGVNFLQPSDAFENIQDGYIFRQVLKSRQGFSQFGNRVDDGSRIMGIFEYIHPDDTKELLVFSKQYLYVYNDTSNEFDQIPLGAGSAATYPYTISNNEAYITGTAYPDKANNGRFLFTSFGLTDIYYYDGTGVFSFTQDNADYQAPPSGALTRARYVLWFGERLNFFAPTIAGTIDNQAVLYSGIRDSSGNGDKFNVSGSGELSADTSDYITGVNQLGDFLVINFVRSTWTLEKTRDAFNPYFIRKVPGVLGTDAPFSSVAWNQQVQSIGKTGILNTDGRQSLRSDNKIPNFTRDEIDQDEFNLTYGGFDRENSQFIFSYKSSPAPISAADTNSQNKVLVNNYEENSWSTYNMRFSCFGQTDKGQTLPWNQIDENVKPSWARMDTTEEIWNKIGVEEETQKTLAGDSNGYVYKLNDDYDDYFRSITNITQASSAVVSVSVAAFEVGDQVYFENVEGMTEINRLTAFVTAVTSSTITVNIDSTDFTAYSTGGSISKFINFSATTIPINPYRDQGRKIYLSHVEVLINAIEPNLNLTVYGDQSFFPLKSQVPLPVTNANNPENTWVTVGVNAEADFITLNLRQSSISNNAEIYAMRLHMEPGGMTSA